MRIRYPLLPGFLLLASTTCSLGQTAPAPSATTEIIPVPVAQAEETPTKWLVKVGLNAGRAFRNGGPYGAASRLPITVGAEYSLSPKVTLYSQLDTDFNLFARETLSGERRPLIPAGALGVGARYYYNQAGRARDNRAHGPFVGNYLAVEAHTELRRGYYRYAEVMPALNLLWGMQRRLGHNFLFDANAGVGLGPFVGTQPVGGRPVGPLTVTTQFNLGLYFGR